MTAVRERFDVLLADLDGTLYRGRHAVPAAVPAIRDAAEAGCRTVYVTNNAARGPGEVAEHLRELGFPAEVADVATSSQAAAAMLAEQLPAGAPVLVVGTAALAAEITAVGLAVTDRAENAVAVVQGHNPETGWHNLAEATVALLAGAVWMACNADATLPTERGPMPGNGSMVAALATATGLTPQVAGKPAPTLLLEAARRMEARAPLVIGDRLDTDIEGGNAAGIPAMLVLTGIATPATLLAAPARQRPEYVADDLTALATDADALRITGRPGWSVTSGETLTLAGEGSALDALRTLCAVHWATGGGPATVRADSDGAVAALKTLGLNGFGPASATVAAEPRPSPAPGEPR